jgi:LPXTG-motif cell wall-anchored protein
VGAGEAGVAGSAEADVDGLPSELARTGAELPLLAGAGLMLLAGGFALRRLPGERR